jgi:hypothetical protein
MEQGRLASWLVETDRIVIPTYGFPYGVKYRRLTLRPDVFVQVPLVQEKRRYVKLWHRNCRYDCRTGNQQ